MRGRLQSGPAATSDRAMQRERPRLDNSKDMRSGLKKLGNHHQRSHERKLVAAKGQRDRELRSLRQLQEKMRARQQMTIEVY